MTTPISTVLVANRGEIARRVFATCRRRGLGTVAVFSDADTGSAHVAEADLAVRLPGMTPAQTYLRGDLIIEAARRAGADAIHPGYGFLSENAAFAKAVGAAGLTWIGPTPESIEAMGSKVRSKKMMAEAGVPVLTRLEPSQIRQEHLPVLVKASAGGGGRGMRVVHRLTDMDSELANAAREAGSAFGDATVFCERYLQRGRHIEVQVMADTHGTVWAVGERECSLQRRHQKVIEEAPSPLVERVGPAMRERLFEASRRAAETIGYHGAGTVEFLADEDGEFFFLEMNTRLQVEHPVTENTTGLDLVALQLDVAAGEPLRGEAPTATGSSIEARLYAEDPARGWQPQSGPVHRFAVPGTSSEFAVLTGRGLRVDSGVVDGDVVGVHYDPMLAKVISVAPTRTEAARLLASALRRMTLHGLVTNRDLLVNTLCHPAFLAGDIDTAFFDRHGLDVLAAPAVDAGGVRIAAVVAAVSDSAFERSQAVVAGGVPSGWRNLAAGYQRRSYALTDDQELTVGYRFGRQGLELEPGGDGAGLASATLVSASPSAVTLEVDGVVQRFEVTRYGDVSAREGQQVVVGSASGSVTLQVCPRFLLATSGASAGSLTAPMPGSVIRIAVQVGDDVEAGQPLLWLEAMKMEHTVAATAAGRVEEVRMQVGQQVELGQVLVVVADTKQEVPV